MGCVRELNRGERFEVKNDTDFWHEEIHPGQGGLEWCEGWGSGRGWDGF